MPKLKKLNRVIEVEASQVDSYLKRGYDQISDNGAVIKKATGGVQISVAEHNKALNKIEELKAQINELKEDVAAYEAEIESLSKQRNSVNNNGSKNQK